mgnify:CR=1 FL=1
MVSVGFLIEPFVKSGVQPAMNPCKVLMAVLAFLSLQPVDADEVPREWMQVSDVLVVLLESGDADGFARAMVPSEEEMREVRDEKESTSTTDLSAGDQQLADMASMYRTSMAKSAERILGWLGKAGIQSKPSVSISEVTADAIGRIHFPLLGRDKHPLPHVGKLTVVAVVDVAATMQRSHGSMLETKGCF